MKSLSKRRIFTKVIKSGIAPKPIDFVENSRIIKSCKVLIALLQIQWISLCKWRLRIEFMFLFSQNICNAFIADTKDIFEYIYIYLWSLCVFKEARCEAVINRTMEMLLVFSFTAARCYISYITTSLSLSLSVSTAIFPGERELAGFIEAKGDGGSGNNWSYKSCKAPVKSSPPSSPLL